METQFQDFWRTSKNIRWEICKVKQEREKVNVEESERDTEEEKQGSRVQERC